MTTERGYRILIHDRDQIYSPELDRLIDGWGVKVLKTPFRSPQANFHCERLIGSLRRGCLDFLIPLSESHLRRIVKDWQIHYNQARPHSSLGPGLPEPRPGLPVPLQEQRHHIPTGYQRTPSLLEPRVGEHCSKWLPQFYCAGQLAMAFRSLSRRQSPRNGRLFHRRATNGWTEYPELFARGPGLREESLLPSDLRTTPRQLPFGQTLMLAS